MAPSAPRSISKSRNRAPLPVRIDSGRSEPSFWKPRRDRKSTRLNSSHTVIYTLSLHDALPIYGAVGAALHLEVEEQGAIAGQDRQRPQRAIFLEAAKRSEEHTSELQSHRDLHSFPTRRSSDLWRRRRRAPSRSRGTGRHCRSGSTAAAASHLSGSRE